MNFNRVWAVTYKEWREIFRDRLFFAMAFVLPIGIFLVVGFGISFDVEKIAFAVLDQEGVGQLIQIAVKKGRATRPDLKVGICGEHGGEPSSVEFCAYNGFNYVSCSPYRVLTARLAAAQAGATQQLGIEGGRTK